MTSKQWAKALLATAALVVALLLLMTQLTGRSSSPMPASEADEAQAVAAAELVEEPAEEADEAEPEPAEEAAAEEQPEAVVEPQPEVEPASMDDPSAGEEADREPPEQIEPEVAVEPPPQPDVAELRNRLNERVEALAEAVQAMEARRDQADAERALARMAATMVDSLEAKARQEDAEADEGTAESLPQSDADLQADLAADAEQQKNVAELLRREFETRKDEVQGAPPAVPASYAGATEVGETTVAHRAASPLPVEEARRLLSAVGEDEAMFIRSLRWNGQAEAARALWIGMGATYALLPPRGSFDPVYRIAGQLTADATPMKVEQDAFFSGFSNRFTYLTTGDDAQRVNAIEARLLDRCGACAGYRLTLVWNWETLALILADARALARNKGLRLPQDVKMIEWLAVPGTGAGTARVDVVRLIGRDGENHVP